MKSYLERQNECGIKVGDKVKVIRAAKSFEDGWGNDWTPDMDIAIGKEYIVIKNVNDFGLILDFDANIAFPYFVLSKFVEKPEPSPQPTDPDFDGYDTDYMDAWIKQAVERHQAELEARRAYDRGMEIIKSNNPKPASGYTATLTFDLTTVDGAEAWHVHKQAYELHSFTFEVLYNLSNNFERDLDYAIEHNDDSDPVQMLRNLIAELADNYNLNVN